MTARRHSCRRPAGIEERASRVSMFRIRRDFLTRRSAVSKRCRPGGRPPADSCTSTSTSLHRRSRRHRCDLVRSPTTMRACPSTGRAYSRDPVVTRLRAGGLPGRFRVQLRTGGRRDPGGRSGELRALVRRCAPAGRDGGAGRARPSPVTTAGDRSCGNAGEGEKRRGASRLCRCQPSLSNQSNRWGQSWRHQASRSGFAHMPPTAPTPR